MALQTVVNPQDPFGHLCKDFYATLGSGSGGASGWSYHDEFSLPEAEDKALVRILDHGECANNTNSNWDFSPPSVIQCVRNCWDPNSSPEACNGEEPPPDEATTATVRSRRKRRRTKSCKNKEELENQRMTHIAVERNRRKQMNEYLAVIRSLMPAAYVQRGDQASIIGGAINFVKELEQLLQTLEAQKRTTYQQPPNNGFSPLFANFFAFPQYSTRLPAATDKETAESRPAFADIEVTMVESHANLKILSKRRPRQLLNMVAGLQCLRFTVLHLNVTTVDQLVLYSLSIKNEEGCQLTTADEIADAVNQLLGKIEEEAFSAAALR